MQRKPRGEKEGIFSHGALSDILVQGLFAALLTAAAFFLGSRFEIGTGSFAEIWRGMVRSGGGETARTMAFLTMAMAESFHALNMRSRHTSVFSMKTKNKTLSFAVLSSILLTLLLIYFPPLTNLFRLEQIPFSLYLLSLGIAGLMVPFVEILKWWKRKGKQ